MSLLQFMILIFSLIFLLFGIDLYKRKKMNIFHLIVFSGWGLLLALFAIKPLYLDQFWRFFGIARWADLLVYVSIIIIFYLYIEIVNSITKDKSELTRFISSMSIRLAYQDNQDQISQIKNKTIKDEFVFNIRAYNESKTIWNVIDEIYRSWFNKILVINDGSTDSTMDVLEQKQSQYPEKLLIIISHEINRGWGSANRTWFEFVKKYWKSLDINRLVGFDADWQMDISCMDRFIHEINWNHHQDLYLWSRFIDGSKTENMPTARRIILWISRVITFIFYGANISDPHSGYRVISLDSLQKFNILSYGMHYANEINEQIKKHKMKYKEIPVNIRYTTYSLSKWQKNSNSIKLAIEMIYKKIFFR